MKRDHLDEAIDLTAARMTVVAEDEGLASRIAQGLPDRSRWLPYGWLPRFAMGALATVAVIVVLRSFDYRSTEVGPAKAGHHTANVPPAQAGAADVPAEVGPRRVGVESAVRRTKGLQVMAVPPVPVDRSDHEFSLPAVAVPGALTLGSLSPVALPEGAPLTIESLEIADLPLTADFSPR